MTRGTSLATRNKIESQEITQNVNGNLCERVIHISRGLLQRNDHGLSSQFVSPAANDCGIDQLRAVIACIH